MRTGVEVHLIPYFTLVPPIFSPSVITRCPWGLLWHGLSCSFAQRAHLLLAAPANVANPQTLSTLVL
jgi:hypothetical protein